MKKMTLADKMAQKSFYGDTIQKSWQAHMQMFGPILEPAFVENYQCRVHLCAALNFISNRDLEKGLKKLQLIQDKLETDADRAAWLFFMGLCFDMAGVQDAMLSFYREAGQYGHRFYLPYLKVAKVAHMGGVYDLAEENFAAAIDCLRDGTLDEQGRMMLASAYSNYASTLTMMHRFEEAFAMLAESEKLMPMFPGRSGTYAVLCAAAGDDARSAASLEQLAREAPAMFSDVKKAVDDIHSGTHPHFFPRNLADEAVAAFWAWFAEREEALRGYVAAQNYDELFAVVQPRLREVLPFLERDPEFALQPTETGVMVSLADAYMVSLTEGYEKLIAACPEELGAFWRFEIVH